MKGTLLPILLGIFFQFYLWTPSSAIYSTVIDKIGWGLGLRRYVRSIVIHAGSTGTRLHSFGFYTSNGGKSIKLDKEVNWEVIPPLHTFARNPYDCVTTLDELIEKAKKEIPSKEWSKTNLVLMATSGISTLPMAHQKQLLDVVKQYLRTTVFTVEEDCITVLDGSDEGLLSWFTLNLILGTFCSKNPKTVISLELGGMSNDITFVPQNGTLNPIIFKYLTEIRAYHQIYEVYSRGYLNFGLNEARVQILQHGKINGSVCISPLIDTVWNYGNRPVIVRGTWATNYVDVTRNNLFSFTTARYSSPVIDVHNCERVVSGVLRQIQKPPRLGNGDIYATAAFFHRLVATDLVHTTRGYGSITVRDIIRITHLKCQQSTIEDPFLCMDLIYFYVLFRDVYGIAENRKIYFANKLYGTTVSWTLGAAFLSLQTRILPRNNHQYAANALYNVLK